MKQIAKKLMVAAVATVAVAGSVHAQDFCPYVGLDAKQIWRSNKGDWTNVFGRSSTGFNAFIGGKVHEMVALEAGYDWAGRKKKNFSFAAGSPFFGVTNSAAFTGSTKVGIKGPYADVQLVMPIENVELVASLGVAFRKPTLSVSVNGAGNLYTAISQLTADKTKALVRLGLGLQGMVHENVGLRAFARWENTSRLHVRANGQLGSLGVSNKAFKDTFSASFGAFYQF